MSKRKAEDHETPQSLFEKGDFTTGVRADFLAYIKKHSGKAKRKTEDCRKEAIRLYELKNKNNNEKKQNKEKNEKNEKKEWTITVVDNNLIFKSETFEKSIIESTLDQFTENEAKTGIIFEGKEYLFENTREIGNFKYFKSFCTSKIQGMNDNLSKITRLSLSPTKSNPKIANSEKMEEEFEKEEEKDTKMEEEDDNQSNLDENEKEKEELEKKEEEMDKNIGEKAKSNKKNDDLNKKKQETEKSDEREMMNDKLNQNEDKNKAQSSDNNNIARKRKSRKGKQKETKGNKRKRSCFR